MTYISVTPAYRSAVITIAPFPASGAMDVTLAPSLGRDIALYLSEMQKPPVPDAE